jgi:RHS repeat-associated protein
MKKLFLLLCSVLMGSSLFAATAVIEGPDPFYGNSGGTFSIQSTGGGVQTSSSQLGTVTGLAQMGFQVGDINLSQGSMAQNEVDLVLPGKGGLDFTLSRSYSSNRYKTEPTMNPTIASSWGAYAGKGWAFNIGMRVYVIRSNDAKNIEKVFLESADGVEEYENSMSKQPGNFNRTEVITTGGKMDDIAEVRFKTTDGKIFAFSKPFLKESYVCTANGLNTAYKIEGYYLTYIRNGLGNSIQLNYNDIQSYDVTENGKLGSTIGEGNTGYIEKNNYKKVGQNRYTQTRVSTVVDSFGRIIVLGYNEATNLFKGGVEGKQGMITSVTYPDINGNPLKIVYNYDNNGCLVGVKIGDLPEKKYNYTSFVPRYIYHEVGEHVQPWSRWHPQYAIIAYLYPDHPSIPEADAWYPDRIDYATKALNDQRDERAGYLLTEIVSPLGSKVQYTYEDSLVTTKNNIQVYGTQYGPNYFLNTGASTPVVVKKAVVSDSGETTVWGFNYPRSNEGYTGFPSTYGYLKKVKYRPNKQDYDAYYFASAEVIINPTEQTDAKGNHRYLVNAAVSVKVEKEVYTFDRAIAVEYTQGIFKTVTEMDSSRNIPVKTTQYKNGIIQTQSETVLFDGYYNPIKTITRKGASLTPIAQQEITYAKTSKSGSANDLINKNLVHIPQLNKATDLTTAIVRSSFAHFNTNGQPLEAYQGDSAAGKLLKTMTYDSQGRVIQESSPLPNGSMSHLNTSYAEGSTYVITKTLNGKFSVSEYELKTGQLIKSTDANGNIVTYQYDRYGRPTSVAYPDGSTDTMAYSTDLKTVTKTSGGITAVQTTDSFGRPILSQATVQEDAKVEYYFGDLPSKTYKKQNGVWVLKSTSVYDTYLRKIQAISPDFGTSIIAYDTPAMNKITSTDPLGRQTIQTMDELGQTTQAQDAGGGLTKMTYNGFGEVVQTIDPRGLIHKADTDTYGRPIKGYFTKQQNTGTPALRSVTQYNINNPDVIDNVQVFSKTNASTPYRTYSYQYDTEGRMTGLLLNGQAQESLTYEEASHTNSKGKLTKAETPDAITQYDFDTMGRITKETTTAKAINKTWDIQYSYNTKGQLTSLRYPDGKLVEYVYDLNQRLSQIKYNSQAVLTYAYNTNGTIANLTYGNGRTMTYTYQKEVLLSGINYNQGQYSQTYTFDNVGKITQTQHNDYINYKTPLTRAYTYTPKDELKTVDLNGSRQYTQAFDNNSNLTRFETLHNRAFTGTNLTQPSQNMIIDVDSDQLLQKNHKEGGRVIKLSYDPEGNLSQKLYTGPYGPWRTVDYAYNYQGQLQTVTDGGNVQGTYGYDHKRQRIYSYTPDTTYTTKYYYWDQSGRIIGEGVASEPSAEFSVRYIYNGNEKVAMERRDMRSGAVQMYYFVNNAQGTPVLIVDSSSNSVSKINLDEYGNPGMVIGDKAEINFTGKKKDLKTELFYFNQRYYDPELGRFLQEDPAQQTFNPYQYCGNNPLMYTDPDGQFAWLIPLFIAALQAGATSAAINATAQYVMTGSINTQSVLNSFGSGALSGGLAFGVGEIGSALKTMGGEGLFEKTMMHGVSGGLQSMAGGGSFGSGFAGGAMGNLAGTFGGTDIASRTAWGAAGGGVGAWASGGDFWQGAQAGAYNQLYNYAWHEGKQMLGEAGKMASKVCQLYMEDPSAQFIESIFKSPLGELTSAYGMADPYGSTPIAKYVQMADHYFTFGKYPTHVVNATRLIGQEALIHSLTPQKRPIPKRAGGGGASRSW